MKTHGERQPVKPPEKRLLVLDVDNTLLHLPRYDPMLFALAELKVSSEDFYRDLPAGGVPLEKASPVKVYPRPHLQEFLHSAQQLGYDLALCTTATSDYLDVVLPLCGIDRGIFCEVIHRDTLKYNPKRRCKDLGQFIHLGYSKEQMVVIDDRPDLYFQRENVLQIEPFEVNPELGEYHKDAELLQMIEKLRYLGDASLAKLRRDARTESQREAAIRDIALKAFNRNKYRDLPFHPDITTKFTPDIDRYPNIGPVTLDIVTFLVFKDYGLVGVIKKEEGGYAINNLCPKEWTEVPGGLNRYSTSDPLLERMFWFRNAPPSLADVCASLGYIVAENDPLTLGAVTLTETCDNLHFLAYFNWFDDEDPMLFK
ncbi:HAD family hydrolase [Gilvimarinus xylanilyticus]|uniref:HAD family hydrolase n=1 Tax=Gilvimarinus xylanilyticus TaxID=2944139 RepID=A0A9X2I5Z5_9GAMM|nr:HAD family hydrolase [Gilvimarinus xylanilyticus]